MEKELIDRYQILFKEAFDKEFSEAYIRMLINNIHTIGKLDGYRQFNIEK